MTITKERLEKLGVAAGIVAAVVAGFYGIVSFVDSRVDKRLTEDETLKKIAALVRPSCVFDQSGSILYDSGAMQLIEEIDLVTPTPEEAAKGGPLPKTIVVRPSQLLREAPIITVLDPYMFEVTASRGKKFDWVYKVDYMAMPNFDVSKCKYRLEILP